MDAGQEISPGFIEALKNLSSSQEDTQNLDKQMAIAKAMRGQQPIQGDYIPRGGVAVRQSPLSVLQQGLGGYMEGMGLKQMKDNATMYRNARGQLIDVMKAHYNVLNNPSENHPDTNAAIANSALTGPMTDEGAMDPGSF